MLLNRPSAIIAPARTHPDVIILAIAARDEAKARSYAKKHGIPVVHSSYQGDDTRAGDLSEFVVDLNSYA